MEVNGPQNCSVSHILQNIFLCVQQNKDIHTGLELLLHFWVNYPFKSYISKRDFSWLNNTQITCSSFDRSSTPSLSNLQKKNNATSVNDLQQRVVFYSRSDDRFRHQPQRTAVVTVECGCGDSRRGTGGSYRRWIPRWRLFWARSPLWAYLWKDAGGFINITVTHTETNCQI